MDDHSCCCCYLGLNVFDQKNGVLTSTILSKSYGKFVWFTSALAYLLQVVIAVAMVSIVATHMQKSDFSMENDYVPIQNSSETVCLMSTNIDQLSYCIFGYVTCGFSLTLSLICGTLMVRITRNSVLHEYPSIICVLFILQLLYLCQQRAQKTIVFLSMLIMVIWWTLGAIVVRVGMAEADRDGIPNENWRNALAILFWCGVGSWGLPLIFFMMYGSMFALVRCCALHAPPHAHRHGPFIQDV